MNFIKIGLENVNLLEKFFSTLIKGKKGFRYFNTRPFLAIKNHLYTSLLYVNNNAVCYGHIDYEDGKAWLGICTSDNELNKGYGKLMMQEILRNAERLDIKTIFLSVDNDNITAMSLYEKLGFVIDQEFTTYTRFKKEV